MSDPRAERAAAFDLARLSTASLTHVGRVRTINQDAYGEFGGPEARRRLLFVADGMGGHRGGEVASQLAVERVGAVFDAYDDPPTVLLDRAFQDANRKIFAASIQDMELAGMGTTGVALLLTHDGRAWVAHVGDSRAYRMRDGRLEQLTGDHSVVGELVRRGQLTAEEARVHPQSNEILRALGTQEGVEVEISEVDVAPGDCFLLCSDGLSGMLTDAQIEEALEADDPEDTARRLVELANQAGGTDNITVQLAIVPSEGWTVHAEPPSAAASGPAAPGAASFEGTMIRWAVAIVLAAALLLLLINGFDQSP